MSRKSCKIDHPLHYNTHPSGIECIDIAEHYNFNLGNALKYIWRAGLKSQHPTEDLEKAVWYVQPRTSSRAKRPRSAANRATESRASAGRSVRSMSRPNVARRDRDRAAMTEIRAITFLLRWAHPQRVNGMATPEDLEADGWTSLGPRDPRYDAVLMRKDVGDE